MAKRVEPAVAYLRTSSATSVGAYKDSDKRQRAAIEAFAKSGGFAIVGDGERRPGRRGGGERPKMLTEWESGLAGAHLPKIVIGGNPGPSLLRRRRASHEICRELLTR